MEKERKPILSKRVLVSLGIVFFLVIAAIFVTIISQEDDNSSSGSFDEPINEENSSEYEENGDETLGDFFGDGIFGISLWILMGVLAGIIFGRNLLRNMF